MSRNGAIVRAQQHGSEPGAASARTSTAAGTATPARPVVHKFGGSILQDGAAFARAAAIVARHAGPRIVVVSAMSGVTDELIRAPEAVRGQEGAVAAIVEAIRRRHQEALAAIAASGPADAGAAAVVDSVCLRLERLLYSLAFGEGPQPRLGDLVKSFGERLSAPVFAAALRRAGAQAVALDADQAGIRTVGPYANAQPDLARLRRDCAHAMQEPLRSGAVPVVTGYYGIDRDGNATLFGRGGSDYVAALVAMAVDAERLVLWKDVAGFMTADPRAVPEARLVRELGYDEAAELAQFGAKVLHPRVVEPLEPMGIPIHVHAVADPDGPGTVVRAPREPGPVPAAGALGAGRGGGATGRDGSGGSDGSGPLAPAPPAVRFPGPAPLADGVGAPVMGTDLAPGIAVRSVARRDGLALLRLRGPGLAATPGIGQRVFAALAPAGVNVLNMAASQTGFALVVEEAEAAAAQRELSGLLGTAIQAIDSHGGRSLLCAVGRGLRPEAVLAAVARRGVTVEMQSSGASAIAMEFLVPTAQAPAALRAVHDDFLGAP